jgi:hypothetical protein
MRCELKLVQPLPKKLSSKVVPQAVIAERLRPSEDHTSCLPFY